MNSTLGQYGNQCGSGSSMSAQACVPKISTTRNSLEAAIEASAALIIRIKNLRGQLVGEDLVDKNTDYPQPSGVLPNLKSKADFLMSALATANNDLTAIERELL